MATRREKVVLELEDAFTAPMLKAAAVTALLDKQLAGLDGSQTRLLKSTRTSGSEFERQGRAMDSYEQKARRAERSSSALVDSLVGLGPALLPIGALAVPALAGLSAELGFAVAGAGTAVLAFHGVGDSLKALDAYQLEPTTANLQKLNDTMSKLGPSGQAFVHQIDALEPKLKSLKVAAENGLLPGVAEGLDDLLTRLPQVRRIISTIAETSGDLAKGAGAGLAGPGFDDFFNYLETDAKPILTDTARSVGNLAEGIGHLFVDFAPQEREFSSFLLDASRNFNDFADGLDKTDGFREFIQFIDTNGPKVADAIGAIAGAVAAIAKAGAPLSGPILDGITAFAKIIDKIASSDLGTPLVTLASGLALVNRALATRDLARGSTLGGLLFGGGAGASGLQRTSAGLATVSGRVRTARSDVGLLTTSFATAGARSERETARISAASNRLKTNLSGVGKGAAVIGAIGLASTGAADGLGLTNTATLALAGSFAGPEGAAIGAGVGFFIDMASATRKAADEQDAYNRALKGSDPAPIRAKVKQLEDQGITRSSPTQVPLFSRNAAPVSRAQDAQLLTRSYAALDRIAALPNAKIGATNTELLASGLQLTSRGATLASESTGKFTAELGQLGIALTARSSLTSYKAAVLAIADALKKNGKTLDLNTQKGIENEQSLEGLAGTALSRAKALEDAGNRTGSIRFLKNAQGDLTRAAEAFGLPRAQARALARQLLGLDALKVNPRIDVKTGQSLGAIAAVSAGLTKLNGKTATTYVDTVHRNKTGGNGGKLPGPSDQSRTFADGGLITGPGGPRDDRILALVSNREYVSDAATVDYYGPQFFDDLKSHAVPRFAGGGLVGKDAADNTLAILQERQQINEIDRELAAKVKKGKRKGKHVLADGSLAREEKQAERDVAVFELDALVNQVAYADAQTAADAAQALADNRTQTASALFGNSSIFSRGTSAGSAEAAANRFLADVQAYSIALNGLIAAGAGAGVLKNVEAVAESGDFRSAAKMARSLISNPAALGNINSTLAAAQAATNQIALTANGAAFAAAGIQGTAGGVSTLRMTVDPLADPTLLVSEITRQVTHNMQTYIASQASR